MTTNMMQHSGSRTVAANEAAAGSGNDVAREPGWWRRAWRRLMPAPDAGLVLAQLNRQLAVLEGARAELEAGWVQGGWWSVRSADGGHRLVTGDAGGSPAQVDGSCLVGALARAGSSSDVGRAVDAVYDALWASRGQQTLPGGIPPVPSPEIRMARVRTLTQWNDRAGRSRAEVLALVDRAINATIMDLASVPRPPAPVGDRGPEASLPGLVLTCPSSGTPATFVLGAVQCGGLSDDQERCPGNEDEADPGDAGAALQARSAWRSGLPGGGPVPAISASPG